MRGDFSLGLTIMTFPVRSAGVILDTMGAKELFQAQIAAVMPYGSRKVTFVIDFVSFIGHA